MKKLLISSMFFISVTGFAFSVSAQDIAFHPGITSKSHSDEGANKIVRETNVNINAARDFKRNYKNAADIKWVQHENGTSVYFTNDGLKMRTSYNSKGTKEYTLTYFEESRMPSDLRQRVRSNYYDHQILIVTEVARNNQVSYLVKMESEKEFLTLKVNDEEMTVFERTKKAI